MKRILLSLVAILCFAAVNAQAPGSFSYQAVVRNSSGNPVTSQAVSYRFSILSGDVSGPVVYSEKHSTTTNQFGLVTLAIGTGTDKTGNLGTLNWGASLYFLKVEIDAAGGSAYVNMGTTQLLSVPYALHAKTAESVSGGISLEAAAASAQPETLLQSFSATLNGIVNPKGFSTTVTFEYGPTLSYGSVAPVTGVLTGNADVPVSAELTGLQSATLYHFRVRAVNAVNVSYSSDLTFTTPGSAPILTTAAVTSISGVSATSGGNISFDGGSPVTARGVCYGLGAEPTLANSYTSDGSGQGSFVSSITGLSPGNTYHVRAYATNSFGTSYGNDIAFNTVSVPVVTTAAVTSINGTTARAGGSVTSDGGSAVTASGLCWGTSPDPTIAGSFNTSFIDAMTGLTAGTVYYVRAYATNVAGTGYGLQQTFNSGQVIGSAYAGGLVFYNDGNGHGLVCTPTDISAGASWGCGSPGGGIPGTLIGGTSSALGSGAANTAAIVAGCSTAGIAARLCSDLELATFSDWYLPSKDELNLMWQNLHQQGLGAFVPNSYLWCSTEFGADYAWVQRFATGGPQANASKGASYYVRAIRGF